MERTRETQLKSLSNVIKCLQTNYPLMGINYDDIMNLVSLYNDLYKERLE